MHFEDSQFEQSRADGWKKLKPNAIPCLFKNPVVPITVFKTDIFRICRICLRVHDSLIHLFKPMSNNQIPFTELMEHTPLQVSNFNIYLFSGYVNVNPRLLTLRHNKRGFMFYHRSADKIAEKQIFYMVYMIHHILKIFFVCFC